LFRCLSCGRGCAILYCGKYFRCRKCYRLTYASQYESQWETARSKADRIRKSLSGKSENVIVGDYNPFPPRSKGMHHKTYRRLKALDRRLLGEAENCLAFEAMRRFGLQFKIQMREAAVNFATRHCRWGRRGFATVGNIATQALPLGPRKVCPCEAHCGGRDSATATAESSLLRITARWGELQ
jgi:hypothetical protein